MATIYKKKYPIPMPEGAEIITRRGKELARWQSGKNQLRTAEVLDDGRVQFVSDCWYVRYRLASGRMRRESTGCRDRQAAQKVLADILAKVEKVKAGVMSQDQMAAAGQLETPIGKHTKDYLKQLTVKTVRGKRVSAKHVEHVRSHLARVVRECGFRKLKDIDRQAVQRWMSKTAHTPRDPQDPDSEPLSARTINMHRAAIVAFCNWCVAAGRLTGHPLVGLPKAEESEPARKRRPLTDDEIARLLKAAQERPLQDALTIRRGANKGQRLAKLSEQERRRLERLGQERALVYKFMMLTGHTPRRGGLADGQCFVPRRSKSVRSHRGQTRQKRLGRHVASARRPGGRPAQARRAIGRGQRRGGPAGYAAVPRRQELPADVQPRPRRRRNRQARRPGPHGGRALPSPHLRYAPGPQRRFAERGAEADAA